MNIRIGNAQSAINRLRQNDLDRRRSATTILQPTAVQGSTSPARVLFTTLGGVARPITQQDLATFRASIAKVGTKLRQGITASEAINLSRPEDLERARKEIRYATPVLVRAGEVRFLSDSGPKSKVTRHHVTVQFVNYAAAVSRPATPLQSAAWLTSEGTLRFECSCEHFTFFLRFVATTGGFVAGRPESGYPKIRNPGLAGVACKHLIRVLTELQGSMMTRRAISRAIESDRLRLDRPGKSKPQEVRITQAEADRITSGRVRRITIIKPEQRGVHLPTPGTQQDVRRTLAALRKRSDIPAAAIAQVLQSLLDNHPKEKR